MKIYNEVTTIFNESTGLWETISEDSFNYSGPVALMQGLPAGATALNEADKFADTIKTTAGYFTNGDGTLEGVGIHTGSLADSNEKYYFNATQTHPLSSSAETQFSVTFGHINGSGSDTYGDSTTSPTTLTGQTEAIYKQFTNLLLEENDARDGFKIESSSTVDKYVYILVGKRARFKDRFNKKTWTLTLSGSNTVGSAGLGLQLTDDSATVAATATPGGPRFNIQSGSLGVLEGTSTVYGHFYPEMGVMIFSGTALSSSIPGHSGGNDKTASFQAHTELFGTDTDDPSFVSCSGFSPNLNAQGNSKNALRLINCMKTVNGTNFRIRSEEDQTQENYFCRVRAAEYNFSTNPTIVSGSLNKIRHAGMRGNPTTFITGVGLYNSAGQLLATAKLSSPLKKNFAAEATIKVKLTY